LSELDRITINYVELEDRIRLAGETNGGTVVIVWITRRLLDRLLPELVQRLENSVEGGHGNALRTDALQTFAQQAARTMSVPQAPVPASAAEAQWLAHSIDVSFSRRFVRLSFKDHQSHCVNLTLEESKLREFLNILFEAYRRADWPTGAWPRWACSVEVEKLQGARVH